MSMHNEPKLFRSWPMIQIKKNHVIEIKING